MAALSKPAHASIQQISNANKFQSFFYIKFSFYTLYMFKIGQTRIFKESKNSMRPSLHTVPSKTYCPPVCKIYVNYIHYVMPNVYYILVHLESHISLSCVSIFLSIVYLPHGRAELWNCAWLQRIDFAIQADTATTSSMIIDPQFALNQNTFTNMNTNRTC